MSVSKEPIRLRKRMMPSGRESLYLDCYVNGSRSYEYLRLYLVPEMGREDRERNAQTLRLAEAIRAKRVVELHNGRFGFTTCKEDTSLFAFYGGCMDRWKERSVATYRIWRSALIHLKSYAKGRDLPFSEVTPQWIDGFGNFLEGKHLAGSTCAEYMSKLRACMNRAYRMRVITDNPVFGLRKERTEVSERVYLTIDELRALAGTPCKHRGVRRAFLFSCLTGLRKSDIVSLTWGEVMAQGGFTRIVFRQKKTGGLEYLDISPEAAKLLGTRGASCERVFGDFHYGASTSLCLRLWARDAGIDKKLTFHSGRHSFAVMMLDLGTDIYTVSKLLGHKELKTTQTYAKVLDKNKQRAVMGIPEIKMAED